MAFKKGLLFARIGLVEKANRMTESRPTDFLAVGFSRGIVQRR
jgi:hypothetical protein